MAEQQKDNFKYIVRVANVDIPGEKPIRIALTKIKGIGINLASVVCTLAGVNKTVKTGNLSDKDVVSLNSVVSNPLKHGLPTWFVNRQKDFETGETNHLLTGKLQYTQENDLKRLKKIKTLRGVRHQKGLTVRGQRTRSNFRKSKGKVIGVSKKK